MAFAVVMVKGPPNRLFYVNGGVDSEGRTNKHYAVEVGFNTFELKASPSGSAISKTVNVLAQDPPMVVDLNQI